MYGSKIKGKIVLKTLEAGLAKSRTMTRGRELELKAAGRLTPSKRLETAAKLSDLCLKLGKAGREALKRGHRKKS